MELKHQAFFQSLFISRLADQILLFLVPLVIFQITGSVGWSGVAFFFETLPRYVSFPICGALCDRISPLRLLHTSQVCRAAACFAGMAAHAVQGGIFWLIAISAVCGVLTSQGIMAREVMLPQVFSGQRFEKVLSYTQIADQLGMVLGPLVAGFLLGIWPWEYVVMLAAVLFLAADAAVILWERAARPQLAEPEAAGGHWAAPLVTAARHIVRLPGLIDVVVLAAAVNLIIGVTLATSAAMVTGIHGQTEFFYAVLQAAGAVATVVILFGIARTTLPLGTLGWVSFTMIFLGAVMTGAGTGPFLYATGFVLVVGFDKMFNVYIRSLRQRIIPRQDYGKTTGLIVMLNNLSQPLAGLLVGLFAGLSGAGGVILALSAVMGLTGVLITVFRWRGKGAGVVQGERTMAELIVWHDGACPLCRREIALMRRLDRRGAIRFVDAAGDDASCPIDRAALLARFHAREDGRLLSGAAAFAAMWRAIPLLRPLGLAARNGYVLAVLERVYTAFLRARPMLQRLAQRFESRGV
jgi:predicted DCC family thiol-disulfide oxidoreductase YuxK/MFS family permease